MQVGYVGLLKAISKFDPAVGTSLASHARPCVTGELKRYFRDTRWPLHVGRPVQELVLQVRDATGPLTQQPGRTPTDADLALHLGVSADDMTQAQIGLRLSISQMHVSRLLDAPVLGYKRLSMFTVVHAADIRRHPGFERFELLSHEQAPDPGSLRAPAPSSRRDGHEETQAPRVDIVHLVPR